MQWPEKYKIAMDDALLRSSTAMHTLPALSGSAVIIQSAISSAVRSHKSILAAAGIVALPRRRMIAIAGIGDGFGVPVRVCFHGGRSKLRSSTVMPLTPFASSR